MARPVKWSRDLYQIREKARLSRTETWGRHDVEILFGVERVAAQNLMKAIGRVYLVAGAHLIDRASLLEFLDNMLQADSIDRAYRGRLLAASPPPRPKPLRMELSPDLRGVTIADLPRNIALSPGRLEITGSDTLSIVESLFLLAQIMQNDLAAVEARLEPTPPPAIQDTDLENFLHRLRNMR